VSDPATLPADLPPPADDGGADHLGGMAMPALALSATTGPDINLSAPHPGWTVVFVYPRTGVPGQPLPEGWDAIPGARGCTPQACAFRDLAADFAAVGARVFGLSAQDTDYQREAADRLRLPFPLLSDADGRLRDALRLPSFEAAGMRLLKRLTLMIRDGRVMQAIYPVFPPDQSAAQALDWLRAR
jgi:peroxiredoxin